MCLELTRSDLFSVDKQLSYRTNDRQKKAQTVSFISAAQTFVAFDPVIKHPITILVPFITLGNTWIKLNLCLFDIKNTSSIVFALFLG